MQSRIFRRIFLDGGTSKLFIVGDPKQAIFGFRGADLPTYLDAAEEMQAEPRPASTRCKATGARTPICSKDSTACSATATGSRASRHSLHFVHPPDDINARHVLENDQTNRPALTIVDTCRNVERLKLAQKQ